MDLIPPMVGRDKELEILYDHLGEAISGHGGLILVSGEAGIGKTRIIRKLSDIATKAGFFTTAGGCVPGIPLPYLPFQEAFAFFSGVPFEAGKSANPSGSRDSTSVLFDSLELLANESAKRPLLICLEDLHWADSATSQLLIYLARNIQRLKILIVGTYRPEDLASSAEGEVHPLQSSMRLMTREGTLTEISLTRIDKDDLSHAIEGMLGPMDPELTRSIHEHSGGNPLFAVETLRMLVSEEKLVQTNGAWSIEREAGITIPRTIQEVILRRVDRLNKVQRKILDCASVIGESFGSSLIAESMGIDELYLMDELDVLSKNFQLVADNENGYSFTHAKIRDVTYEAISKPRRVELHKRIGCVLENRLPDDALLSALSWHFLQAQNKEKCMKYSVRAGEKFLLETSYLEATLLFKRTLDTLPEDSGNTFEQLKALEGLGDIYREQNANLESSKYYERFLKLSHDSRDKARVQWKSSENWLPMNLGNGDPTHALYLLDQAESCDGLCAEDIARIEHIRAWIFFDSDEIDKAAISLKRTLENLSSSGNRWKLSEAMLLDCYIDMKRFKLTNVLDKAKLFLEKAQESKNRRSLIFAERLMGDACVYLDQPEQALIHFSRTMDLAHQSGDFGMLAYCLQRKSGIEDEAGDFSSARSDAEKALKIEIVNNDAFSLSRCHALLGKACLHCGDLKAADAYLINGLEYLHQLSGPTRKGCEGEWSWSRAELEIASGHFQEGFEYFDKAIINLEEAGPFYLYFTARCCFDYAKPLIERGSTVKAKERLDKAYEILTLMNRLSFRKKVEELRACLVH